MREIVFAKTNPPYESYTDWYKLVEVSGFRTIWLKDLDVREDLIVITTPFTGEIRQHIQHRERELGHKRRASLIWWCLERGPLNGDEPEYVDEIWISDRWYATLIPERSRFVVLGSDANLADGPMREPKDRIYAGVHLMYVWGRRQNLMERLYKEKVADRELGGSLWGSKRHDALSKSRFMWTVRQDDTFEKKWPPHVPVPVPIIEPLRFALAAAYGIPLISETAMDTYPYEPGIDYVQADFWQFHNIVRQCLSEPYEKYWMMGERMRQKMCFDFNFRQEVLKAAEALQ